MAKKGNRPTARHILEFLKPNKGIAVRFSHIYKEMRKKGYHHNSSSISQNLKYLVEQKKIVSIKRDLHASFYGIPDTRPDGTKFIITKENFNEDKIVELGK